MADFKRNIASRVWDVKRNYMAGRYFCGRMRLPPIKIAINSDF